MIAMLIATIGAVIVSANPDLFADLTDEQRQEIRDFKNSLIEEGYTKEEVHEAMKEKLEENGIVLPTREEMLDKKIEALSSNVFILSWLNEAKRNTLFSMANLVVMPSLLEYFPYSILEPAICNLPIISSKIKCVTEIFKNEKECL